MPKPGLVFLCSDCGEEFPKWLGQCPSCRAWNTLEEYRPPAVGGKRASPSGRALSSRQDLLRAEPRPLTEVDPDQSPRMALAWGEINRVLGGGIVAGSLVLVGGEPGVGKSTLLMHVAQQAAAGGARVLYVSGEESGQQVRMRSGRLGALEPNILFLAENDLVSVVEALERVEPALAIVDSIQTIQDPEQSGSPGSVSQVKAAAASLMRVAKGRSIPVFLVGHVNKEGALAGPRVLEHLVDTVLYLEGDRNREFRILRATKNRFGSTDEIGIFTMSGQGLEEVADASAALLSGSSLSAGGSVVVATLEGTRPLLIELQSLVSPTPFGLPRRSVNGFDLGRLHMIVAVLEKRARMALGNADIFVNVVGGIQLGEPAADLALALSVASNLSDHPLGDRTVVIGELGLAGEVRRVGQLSRRLGEAARRGFTRAIVPPLAGAADTAGLPDSLDVLPVPDLDAALTVAFGEPAWRGR